MLPVKSPVTSPVNTAEVELSPLLNIVFPLSFLMLPVKSPVTSPVNTAGVELSPLLNIVFPLSFFMLPVKSPVNPLLALILVPVISPLYFHQ